MSAPLLCADCGLPLPKRRGNYKYCSDTCGNAAIRQKQREWYTRVKHDPVFIERRQRYYQRVREQVLVKVKERYWASDEVRAKHKVSARKYQVSLYGLTPEDYTAMVEAQQSRCAICRAMVSGNLHVDHDHISGKVRGLLCGPCNRLLGLAKDEAETLRAAIEYLERWPRNETSNSLRS